MMQSGPQRATRPSPSEVHPQPQPARRARRLTLLAAALLLLAAACGTKTNTTAPGGGTTVPATPTNLSTRPSTPAVLAIISPTPGATVTGTTLQVQLSLTGATLEPPGATDTVVPTEGHVHLSLDGSIVSMTGTLTQSFAVTPGPHILSAEFVANDHEPFYPRKIVTVMFTDTA
jgi:hypothetical protein